MNRPCIPSDVISDMNSRFLINRRQSQMQIATSETAGHDTRTAIRSVLTGLVSRQGRAPDFLSLHYSANHDAGLLRQAVAGLCPGTAFIGASSCLGIMTEKSLMIGEEGGIGAFAIWDKNGDFGSASSQLGTDPAADAARIARIALERAGRPGEMPDLAWISAAPGCEEEVLRGLREVLGDRTVIVGGSSADNEVAGGWSQFGPDSVHSNGLALCVVFSSGFVSSVYHSGYVETGHKGRVTRIEGRRLFEIDGRPAAEVYSEWTGLTLPEARGAAPVPILPETTFFPLGHETGMIASLPFHLLVHPAAVWPDGSFDLFAQLSEGEEICSMRGTAGSLIARAGRLAELVSSSLSAQNAALRGALIVYCGGCMLGVREEMEQVRQGILAQMGGQPFLGTFSFGEQGKVRGSGTRHGNLMISCTGFANVE